MGWTHWVEYLEDGQEGEAAKLPHRAQRARASVPISTGSQQAVRARGGPAGVIHARIRWTPNVLADQTPESSCCNTLFLTRGPPN